MKQLLPMYKHDHITKEDYRVTLRTLTRLILLSRHTMRRVHKGLLKHEGLYITLTLTLQREGERDDIFTNSLLQLRTPIQTKTTREKQNKQKK